MNHLTEDMLLKFSLELLDSGEKSSVEEHLKTCSRCRSTLSKIAEGNRVFSEFDPKLPVTSCPLPRRSAGKKYWWLKAAALLLVGFLAGFGAANYLQPDCVNVIPYASRLKVESAASSLPVVCESLTLAVTVR